MNAKIELLDEVNNIEKLRNWVESQGAESVAYALSTIDKYWGKVSEEDIFKEIVRLLD